jgi:lactate dehydrogenase-like 2-hydroxyacid dehydrogenase
MADKVLIYSRFPKTMMARFAERFELLDTGGKPAREVFSADELAGIRAMLTAGGSPLGAEAMDLFPKLGAIVCYGTGYDGVDLKAAAARNIAVGHSPGANAASVADIAMTLMLATTRRILVADQYVRSGDWAGSKQSPMMRPQAGMPGRRIGVYGMGEIGRKIAARCAAFESEVGYFSRTKYDLPYQYFPTLEALADWCSVLMIAVLIAALSDKTIAGAGLDVFDKEPHAPDALTALPNVVFAPHIGGHTLESHVAMQNCVLANLTAFFAGKPLPYGVKSA